MDVTSLVERLRRNEFVALSREDWDVVAPAFEVVEDHDTNLSGRLLIVQLGELTAVVEAPKPSERVVRPLTDVAEARAFVQDRLDTYERMWDGCGCKVDYYR